MHRLLCHICGGPSDHNADGHLWLLPDCRDEGGDWPLGRGITEPPICGPCAHRSLALCPALRRQGGVLLRVRRAPVTGVHGGFYRPAGNYWANARLIEAVTITYRDYRIRWTRAHQQVRTIEDCVILDPDEFRHHLRTPPAQSDAAEMWQR